MLSKNWPLIINTIKDEQYFSENTINRYFNNIFFDKINNQVLYLTVDKDYYTDYLIDNFKNKFSTILLDIINSHFNVTINDIVINYKQYHQENISTLNNTTNSLNDSLSTNNNQHNFEQDKKTLEIINTNPNYSFENYILGPENAITVSIAKEVAECNGEPTNNPFLIYGESGIGKTHILISIARHIINQKNKNVLYVTCETLINDIVNTFGIKTMDRENLFKKYRSVDVLIIDDIQYIIGKESSTNEFFNIFNELFLAKKQIILSSDVKPDKMKGLEDRLKSRFNAGTSIDLKNPSYETRIAILNKKFKNETFTIDEQCINFIAEHFTNNVRELEGVIGKLRSFSKFYGQQHLSKDKVEEYLSVKITSTENLSTDSVFIKVCREFDVDKNTILSNSRKKEVTITRQIIMYLLRELLNLKYEEIGKLVCRNHSTVISGIKKANEFLTEDRDLNKRVNLIIQHLKSNSV